MAKFVLARQAAANIVSSLTHQTDLLSDTIDVDLHEFGSVSVKYEAGALRRLARKLSTQARCRNNTLKTTTTPPPKCSSFVLALTSFAGKAPFRALDSPQQQQQQQLQQPNDFLQQHSIRRHNHQRQKAVAGASSVSSNSRQSMLLRVPVIQIDWLSPIDGSSLIDLLRQDGELNNSGAGAGGGGANQNGDLLSLADFRATVTFAIPRVAGDDQLDKNSPYKCYKFVEAANEWIEQKADREQLEEAAAGPISGAAASADENGAGASGNGERRFIRCAYDGFGVLGAFQGKPPAIETTTSELSIALGIATILAIVTIFSLLGCIASKSKAKHGRRQQKQQLQQQQQLRSESDNSSSGNSRGSVSYESDDYNDEIQQSRR